MLKKNNVSSFTLMLNIEIVQFMKKRNHLMGMVLLLGIVPVWHASAQLSDDVIFDAPNPFAENLENQGISQEFSVDGMGEDDAGMEEESSFYNPYASPDFDPNAEALFDPNADLNLYTEENFAESVEGNTPGARKRAAAKKKAEKAKKLGKRDDKLKKLQEDQDLLIAGGGSLAKLTVLKYACSTGGTIARCMQRKALMPNFKDKGWSVKSDGENRYIVGRVLLMNGTLPLTYSWLVDERGEVEPLTIRAEMITEMPF